MNPLRAGLALRLAAACAPRYINVGMPKCGSNSVSSFYRCHGMTSAHWQISRGDFVGDEAHACDARGRPLLDCGPYLGVGSISGCLSLRQAARRPRDRESSVSGVSLSAAARGSFLYTETVRQRGTRRPPGSASP